jgi:hypothetical protein
MDDRMPPARLGRDSRSVLSGLSIPSESPFLYSSKFASGISSRRSVHPAQNWDFRPPEHVSHLSLLQP